MAERDVAVEYSTPFGASHSDAGKANKSSNSPMDFKTGRRRSSSYRIFGESVSAVPIPRSTWGRLLDVASRRVQRDSGKHGSRFGQKPSCIYSGKSVRSRCPRWQRSALSDSLGLPLSCLRVRALPSRTLTTWWPQTREDCPGSGYFLLRLAPTPKLSMPRKEAHEMK